MQQLTMAVNPYDRIQPLQRGAVDIPGVDLAIEDASDIDLFAEISERANYAITEMSLSTFVLWTSRDECPYVGIPAFVSRMFRHSALYANTEAGIDSPADLVGTRVGVIPEYQSTSATYVRGMLREEYGVDPADVTWITHQAERMPLDLPDDVSVTVAPEDEELPGMLDAGRLDALVTTRLLDPDLGNVERVFADYKAAERDYYERTGIFPIMHLVLLKEDVYRDEPRIATALYDALVEAKRIAIDRLYDTDAPHVTLPWVVAHVEESREVFGEEYWPYGFRSSRETLEAITRYSYEQGLSARKVAPEELFVEELLDTGPD